MSSTFVTRQSPEIKTQQLATLETASVTGKTFAEGTEGNHRLKGPLALWFTAPGFAPPAQAGIIGWPKGAPAAARRRAQHERAEHDSAHHAKE